MLSLKTKSFSFSCFTIIFYYPKWLINLLEVKKRVGYFFWPVTHNEFIYTLKEWRELAEDVINNKEYFIKRWKAKENPFRQVRIRTENGKKIYEDIKKPLAGTNYFKPFFDDSIGKRIESTSEMRSLEKSGYHHLKIDEANKLMAKNKEAHAQKRRANIRKNAEALVSKMSQGYNPAKDLAEKGIMKHYKPD